LRPRRQRCQRSRPPDGAGDLRITLISLAAHFKWAAKPNRTSFCKAPECPTMIVLGSRSPRRFELLSLLVGQERIIVRPPAEVDEAGFEGLHARAEITDRLRDIARTKNEDV